jgi:phosphoserine phosphatase RsbU/P
VSDITSAQAQRLERLRTLTEVSRALTYATSIDEVLRLTVERAAGLMGASKALIMLSDDEGRLTVRAAHGVDEEKIQELRAPLSETLMRRLQGLLGYPSEECFVSVPLVAQGEVTGLLAAVRRHPTRNNEDDEWLLSALADQAAVALENARLAEAVRGAQDAAVKRAKAEGQIQATLGHELRSPLTAIQAYSALLLDGLHGPLNERQRESVSRIRMSGEHLLSVIENVLDVGRINAGVMTIKPRDVLVSNVLTEALHIVRPWAADKKQTVELPAREELVVRAEPNRLRQALVNLLANAVKYTPDGGTIRLRTRAADRQGAAFAAISVTDDGRGIEPRILDSIFEPYNRGDAGPFEAGLGLGLFISRELVRRMNGDIEVESEPGRGSTFTIHLPVAAGAPTPR